MLRYKYNPTWKYVDIYDDETKICTVNYVETIEDAEVIANAIYKQYKGITWLSDDMLPKKLS